MTLTIYKTVVTKSVVGVLCVILMSNAMNSKVSGMEMRSKEVKLTLASLSAIGKNILFIGWAYLKLLLDFKCPLESRLQ